MCHLPNSVFISLSKKFLFENNFKLKEIQEQYKQYLYRCSLLGMHSSTWAILPVQHMFFDLHPNKTISSWKDPKLKIHRTHLTTWTAHHSLATQHTIGCSCPSLWSCGWLGAAHYHKEGRNILNWEKVKIQNSNFAFYCWVELLLYHQVEKP
jgi:hypothetical protein